MRRTRLASALALAAAAAAVGGAAPGARGADPGRWVETGRSDIPLEYYQGVAADPGRNLFFDGIYFGLYRTNPNLRETGRNPDVIPPQVGALPPVGEGYNHIGDIDWDAAEGGRILLPLECYYPGQANGGNTCKTGSFGVADPATLNWRYYVKLDPAEIPKAMFAVVSPDRQLIWTSSGNDLLAYRTADITAANAAPGGPLIRAVRRLPNAVPPSGITGAAFYRGRMYVAGQGLGPFQVWSIDVADGTRRLEIERQLVGESEGLAVSQVLGGVLHWVITPFNPEGRQPTYGPNHNVLLHFVARGSQQGRLRLSARPPRARTGRRTRFRFRVTRRVGSDTVPVRGATVRLGRRRARTNADGRADVYVRFRRPGRKTARATKAGFSPAAATIRAFRVRRTLSLTAAR